MTIYIYIYIYIVKLFVVSLVFGVARLIGRLKLGSKPVQLYVRPSIISLSHSVDIRNYKAFCNSVRLFTFALPYT